MTKTPLVVPAISLITGILVGHYFPTSVTTSLVMLATLTLAALLCGRHPQWQSVAIALAVVALGVTLITADQQSSAPEAGLLERSRSYFLDVRAQLLERYKAMGLAEEDYATVAAMTLGDRHGLTRELRESYNTSGAAHVLALSGLHLGIIYALLSMLTVGRRRRLATQVAIILSIWGFAFLVGLPPSIVRSATMLTVYALLQLGNRDGLTLNVLAFTAIVMLCLSPSSLFSVSFQLSFLSVLGITLFYRPLYDLLPPAFLQRHRLAKWTWGMICVSIGAQTGAAPLVAYYFGNFPLLFLLTNFIVVPAVTLILYLSLFSLLLPFLTVLPLALTTVTGWLNTTLRCLAAIPRASVSGLSPSPTQIVAVYVVILATYFLLTKMRRTETPFS